MKTVPESARWGVLAFGLAVLVPAWGQPCEDKHWVPEPVLARASTDGVGLGGTGRSDSQGDDHGIGGTGHGAPDGRLAQALARAGGDDHGIGGTGIVGVVAGYGSICVNGREIHFTADTPMAQNGLPVQGLPGLGQMVAVRAVDLGGGEYMAREIHLVDSVSGPVSAVDPAVSSVLVLGQHVRVPAGFLEQIQVGEMISVSGNRLPDGSILATRIQRLPRLAALSVIGPVSQAGNGSFRIGSLDIQLSGMATPAEGEEVQVRGRLENGVLVAEALVTQPYARFSVPVRQWSIQGYVRAGRAGQINVDGTLLSLSGTPGPALGSRVEISARVDGDGRLVAERMSVERMPADARLNRGSNQPENLPARTLDGSASAVDPTNRPALPQTAQSLRAESAGAIELPRPVLQRPEILRPEVVRPDLARPDLVRPDVVRPDWSRPEILRPDLPGRGR